jgi:hypothetical protein
MNDSPDGPAPPVVPRRRTIVVCLLLLGAVAHDRVQASPIRTRHPLVRARAEPTAETYFARALRNQWRHVDVPPTLRLLRAPDGLLPDTAFVRYLRWRRELHTARFDRWHPRVAAMMIRDAQLRGAAVLPPSLPPSPPPIQPRSEAPTLPSPPPVDQETTIPEPASLLMAIVLAGSVALARRRTLGRGPRPAPPAA